MARKISNYSEPLEAHCGETCQDCNVDARVVFLTSSGFIRPEQITLKRTTEITYPLYHKKYAMHRQLLYKYWTAISGNHTHMDNDLTK